MYKAAVIGDSASVSGFAALGLSVFRETEPEKITKLISRLAANDFAVIYITEPAAALVKDAASLIRVDLLPYQRAAGAKYEMVGRSYAVDFDEAKRPEMFTDVFDRAGIPYQLFR